VRYGGAFSYAFTVTPGRTYRVRATFDEVYWAGAGVRSFNVLVNGVVRVPGVDPFGLTGAQFAGVLREFDVAAAGSSLVVGFAATADNAILAALEVFDMGVSS
jgi:hypothetical protein